MSWTPSPDLTQPGAASDAVVGEAHGVSRHIVGRYRRAHGIPGWTTAAPSPLVLRLVVTPAQRAELDAALAAGGAEFDEAARWALRALLG